MAKEVLLAELTPQDVTDLRRIERNINDVNKFTPTLILTIHGT